MLLHRRSKYKHLAGKSMQLGLTGAFTLISLVPSNTLAFEAELPIAVTPRLTAEVQIANKIDATKSPAVRDPYLVGAINSLPNYSYQSLTATAGNTTPVTISGDWSQQEIQATIAFVPTLIATESKTASDTSLVLEGEASFYSRNGCLGCNPGRIMANGQPLNDNALTMAIGADKKHLVGRQAKVTSLATGQSTVVTITDTGGFYQAKYGNRVADLTIATKQAIGMQGGVGQVRVEIY
jgi:rare lipoprotein A (peptidoglycan hydrolase)